MSSVIKDGHVFITNPSTLEEIAKIKCSTSQNKLRLPIFVKNYENKNDLNNIFPIFFGQLIFLSALIFLILNEN